MDLCFAVIGDRGFCNRAKELTDALQSIAEPFVMWSGLYRDVDKFLDVELLSEVPDFVDCMVIGEEKPSHMEWIDYFIAQLGIPILWRTCELKRLVLGERIARPLEKYRLYEYALRLAPDRLRVMQEGTRFQYISMLQKTFRPQIELSSILPLLHDRSHSCPFTPSAHPLVTIVICTYNEERRVGIALRSVLAQTNENWECIVVDDGSTDHTLVSVREFCDPRLRIEVLPVNQGKAHALNVALAKARGKCFLELDADDWLDPQAVAVFSAEMERLPHDVGLLSSQYHEWRETVRGELVYRGIAGKEAIMISKDWARVPIPRCYRTSVIQKLGGFSLADSSFGRLYEDVAMTIKIIHKSRIERLQQPLYHRVIRRASVSQVYARAYQKWAQDNLEE
ncbi:glycosyltransferase family 2 protein [Sulfoacidibacillus thermotolerans]|uniref:Glycosyltransferase 2-like domain-containing protein n=1 Tax=Sulfoacidibacillus thermotolerans TaxID=1765684 RepID=A0A2U3D854_SULT2|nr:glycosyltransferase family 2 protein [Sulfoacidibacillus thermotolerans]PWI57466.1 hypothetical protein BM613_08300 [Sulfoacidibacillus thermotolerans]